MASVASAATPTLNRGPRPQGPRRPRERLASLKNRATSLRARSASLQPIRGPSSQARCPECGSTDLSDLDGTTVCAECGTTINESNIVAEVTFGESAAGAAIVQGGFVGEGQRHARTGQPGRYIHEAREPREVSEANGRDEIRKQANWLTLSDHVVDQAISIYKLALNYNFVQGRLIKVVAAVCLYAACRRDPRNQIILMDFAEGIAVNVFKLGQTWTDLKKSLFLEDLRHVPVIEVENLILKFARKLEFGNSLMRIAEDAARILKRMKRDWIVTGRRPAGLVGACIILAARMNNFRRTVREVVYVVKVADMTLVKRLEEFNRTQSSNLTVDQFRKHGLRLKKTHDPPAFTEGEQREQKRQRLERAVPGVLEDEEEEEREGEVLQLLTPNTQTGNEPGPRRSTRQNPRRDAEGFVIPDIPASSANQNKTRAQKRQAEEAHVEELTTEDEPPKKKKAGRPRKSEQRPTPIPVITEADLIEEHELEKEMENILNDPDSIAVVEDAAVDERAEARARMLAESMRNPSVTRPAAIPEDPEIGEHEFEDDPEVANCLLSEEERRVKERIWVTHNEDWLRARQEKMLKKAADEASGAVKKQKRKRAKGRMGDGSLLEGAPVTSAAEAARRMLEKRAVNPSKHINYQNVDRIYASLQPPRAPDSSSETDEASRAGSVAPSEASEMSGEGVQPHSTAVSNQQQPVTRSVKKAVPQPRVAAQTTRRQAARNAAQGLQEKESGFDTGEDPEEQLTDDDEDVESAVQALGFDWGD